LAGLDWELLYKSALLNVGAPSTKLPIPIVISFGDALSGRQRSNQRYALLRAERAEWAVQGRAYCSSEWVRVTSARETVNGSAVTTIAPNFTLGDFRYYDVLQARAGPASALVLAQVTRPSRLTVLPVFSTTIAVVISLPLDTFTLQQCTLYQIRVRGIRTGDGWVVLAPKFVWRESESDASVPLLHGEREPPREFRAVVSGSDLPPEGAYFAIRLGDRNRWSEWSEETDYIALLRPHAYDFRGRGLLRAVVESTSVVLRWRHLGNLEGATPLEYCTVVYQLSFNQRNIHATFCLGRGVFQALEPPRSRTPSPFPQVIVATEEVAEEEPETLWNYKPRAPPPPLRGEAVFELDGEDVVLRVDGLTSNAYYEAEVYVRYRGIAAWERRPAFSVSFRASSSLENAMVQVRVMGPDGLPERTEVPVEGNSRVALHCAAREHARKNNPLQRAPRTPRELVSAAHEAQQGRVVVSLLKEGIAGMKHLLEGKRPVAPPLPKLRGNYPRSR
jgi:hypothetical protein